MITKIEAEPEQISEGQQITVRMEVKNEKLDGEKEQAEVDVTAPEKLVIDGTGKATLLPSNESQSAKIPGGGTYTFQWVYETTSDEPRSAGKIYFKAFVEGKDGNSDLSIKSNEMISNSVVIQRPATLKCTEAKIVEPQPDESGNYQVSEGQNIILGIKVTNTDGLVDENSTQAAATNVLPKVNTNIYETVTIEGPESPEPIILPAESTHTFTLIYKNASLYMEKEKGTGTIEFKVSVTGFDENDSERDLSCLPISLPVVTVVSRPAIEITKVEANKLQFSIGLEFQGNLDNSIIMEDLKQEFKNNGISLSENAAILIEEIGSRWLINDENKKYTVKKEENKLNIYTQLIGIEQAFDIIVSIENKGKSTAIITPSSSDLSLPEVQYVIVPPPRLELAGGMSQTTIYKVQTIKNKTESGKVTVELKQLDIVDKNEPTKKIGYNESPDARDKIELDMAPPQFIHVLYQDDNKNGEVEQGEKLILIFNEAVMGINGISGDEFVLSPGNNTLGEEPKFSFEKDQVIITLGNGPMLSPEGEYRIDGPEPSGLGIKVPNSHIVDEAGNVLLDSPILDIDIEDEELPTINTAFPEGGKTSAIPTFEFRIRDESASFDSGINLETLEFNLNNSPREWRLIEEPTENLLNGTSTTIANVEIIEPESVIVPISVSIGQQLRKDVKLKVVFQNPLLEVKHELEVIIEDNKDNIASKKIGFVVSKESVTIIDLATYPNPFAIGRSAIIRYILSRDVNDVTINIYDVSGRLVWTRKTSGRNGLNDDIRWDGRTEKGNEVSAGIYICELIAEDEHKYWRIAVRPPE